MNINGRKGQGAGAGSYDDNGMSNSGGFGTQMPKPSGMKPSGKIRNAGANSGAFDGQGKMKRRTISTPKL